MTLINKFRRFIKDNFSNEKQKNEIALIQIISALLIVNYHTGSLNVPFLRNFARFGFVFNTVFVGLSGYLLAFSAQERRFSQEWIWRRFIRLYPVYWVSVGFIVLIQYMIGNKVLFPEIMIHLTGLQYFLGSAALGRHLWFVSVIVGCYLLFWPSLALVRKIPVAFSW